MKKSSKIIITVLIITLLAIIGVGAYILVKDNTNSKEKIMSLENQIATMEKERNINVTTDYEDTTTKQNAIAKDSTTIQQKENNSDAKGNTSTRENEVLKAKEDIKNYIFNKEWVSEIDEFKNEKKENITIDSDSTFYLIDSDRGGLPTYVVNLSATISKKEESGEDYQMTYGNLLLVSHNGKNAFCEVIDGQKSGFSSIHASMDGRTIRTVVTKKGIKRTTYISIYAKDDTVNRKTILDEDIDSNKYYKTVISYDEITEEREISKSEYDSTMAEFEKENFLDMDNKLSREKF